MEKHIINEKTGISYARQGDYYFLDLELPTEEEKPVGIWGQRHSEYIRQYKKGFYLNLLTSCKLNSYLANVDKQAEDMFFRLEKEYAERAGSDRTVKGRKSVFMDSKDE